MDFWLIVVIVFAAALVIGFGIVILRGRADAVSGAISSSSGLGTTATATAAAPAAGAARMDREALDAAVGALLAEGRVVMAVKLIRDQTGLGLAQSKAYVDRLAAGGEAVAAASAETTRTSISSDAMAQIQLLVAQDKKIQAIKEVRRHTGLGLKAAKDLVDRMEESAVVGALDVPTAAPQLSPSSTISDEVMARVRALAAQGKKIHAIKELRDHTPGLGLKEAKDIVERL